MARAYPGPTALQARINQCFEHSLNGRALCTPGAACDADANMSALVAYMAWLDRAYRTRGATAPPARGFPDEASADARSPGDPARGEALYAQRCAFCHGADGAGRYGHDTYFRPALWGARSFAATAGMARAPTLAAFIRANMPYTSGGSLSWADARDLAAFIGARCRPPATCP